MSLSNYYLLLCFLFPQQRALRGSQEIAILALHIYLDLPEQTMAICIDFRADILPHNLNGNAC